MRPKFASLPAPFVTPISLHILLAIADDPLHGYGILKRIEVETSGRLVLEAGTLYAAIKRMQDEGLMEVAADVRSDVEDSRRRYYRLTAEGRRVLRAECDRMSDVLRLARQKNVLPATARGRR